MPGRFGVTIRLAQLCSTLVCVLGGAVLIGWAGEVPWLLSPVDGTVPMKPNTAFGFIVAGAAVLAFIRAGAWLSPAYVAAVLITLLGASTLAEYLLSLDFGIDTLLHAPRDSNGMALNTRMSPSTAVCFVLVGFGLLIARVRTTLRIGIATAMQVVVQTIAFIGLAGYTFGAPVFYLGGLPVEAMAVHTAAGFMLLALAALFVHTPSGIEALLRGDSLAGMHFRTLLPASVALPLAIGAVALLGYDVVYGTKTAVALTAVGSALAIAGVVTVTHILLDRSEQFLRLKDRALEAVGVGVIITDHAGDDEPIVYTNPAFSAITGYSAVEALGRNCRFLNRGVANPERDLDNLRDAIRHGTSCEVEIKNRRRDGALFWNHFSLAPVHATSGEISHFVGVIDDVTADIRREQRLTSAMRNLTRTTQTMETFVRIVSHELRGPLNAASTWVALMEVDASPENIEQGLEAIQQSIDDQARLISDLVEASQAAMPSLDLEFKTVDLGELLEQLVVDWAPRIEEAGQTIDADLAAADSALLQGDPTRLRQIFGNLISNAHKYSPSGACIRIGLERTGASLSCSVEDDGIGIAIEDQDRVFDMNWRASRTVHGLGLGLTIVKELVEAHHGTITVSSDGPGCGSRFTVRLPIAAP